LSDKFKTISLVIDTSSPGHPTLTIHVDGKEAEPTAEEVEPFSQSMALIPNESTTLRQIYTYWQR